MLRIQYRRYGGPEVMRLEDVEVPMPVRDEIRVRVRAASCNPADRAVRGGNLKFISGSRFPRGLGHDFSGVIDAIGPGVTQVKIGDAVFGVMGIRAGGAFAEYLVTSQKNAYPKPKNLSFEAAAALPMAGVTAFSAVVEKARLRAGQSVFITGCLGAVGRSAVQLALASGATVAGNCSASGLQEALALGVNEVTDYRTFDCEAYRHRFDAVIDTAAALSLNQCSSMLKSGGLAVLVALSPRTVLVSVLSSRYKLASGSPTPARIAAITQAAESGTLQPKIGRIVTLPKAIPAIMELEASGVPKGKLVIVPSL